MSRPCSSATSLAWQTSFWRVSAFLQFPSYSVGVLAQHSASLPHFDGFPLQRVRRLHFIGCLSRYLPRFRPRSFPRYLRICVCARIPQNIGSSRPTAWNALTGPGSGEACHCSATSLTEMGASNRTRSFEYRLRAFLFVFVISGSVLAALRLFRTFLRFLSTRTRYYTSEFFAHTAFVSTLAVPCSMPA